MPPSHIVQIALELSKHTDIDQEGCEAIARAIERALTEGGFVICEICKGEQE